MCQNPTKEENLQIIESILGIFMLPLDVNGQIER